MYPLLLVLSLNLVMASEGFEGMVMAVCDITCDWPAWLFIACLRYWSHTYFPCPLCDIPLVRMMNLSNVSHRGGPWQLFTAEEYDNLLKLYLKDAWALV